MANANGSIDEVIGSEAGKQVTDLTEKMNGLYVAFKQNITAINLVNDALSKSTSIKDVSENVDKATKSTKKLKDVQTEFVETVYKLDKAVSDTGHALSDQEVAMAKLTATMANGNKAAKLVTDETKKQSTATKELEGNYKALLAQQKAALAQAREVGVVYGTSSQKFKDAAQSANAYSVQVNSMNKQLGIHNSEVGNYAENIKKGTSGIVSGLNSIWGGVRKLAYILPGLGIAGIFSLLGEGIVNVVSQLDIFSDKLTVAKSKLDIVGELQNSSKVVDAMQKITDLQKLFADATISTEAKLRSYNEVMGKIWDKETDYGKAKQNLIDLSPAYIQMLEDEAFADLASKHLAEAKYKKDLDEKQNSIKNNPTTGVYDDAGNLKSMLDKLKLHFVTLEGIKESFYVNGQQKGESDFAIQKKIDEKTTKQIDDDLKVRKSVYDEAYANGLISKAKYEEALKKAGVTPGDAKIDKPKEVNRIDDLKKSFEAEKLMIETANEKGYTTELEYRNKLLTLINEYVNAKETALGALSQHEKESQTTFNLSLHRETKSNISAIEKYYADQLKMMEVYDTQVKKNDEIKVKDKQTVNEKYEALDDKLWKAQFAGTQAQFDDVKAKLAAEIKLKQDKAVLEEAIINASFSIANSISDAIHAKELQQIEDKATALDEAHNNQIKQIEQSGLTSIQQTKAKAKADAQYEAEKKKIDKDRKKALHEQARLNRDLALFEVAIRTAVNITKEFHNPYLMAAAAALGIAQAAAIVLKPLPAYAKGRGKGKAEHAIVGEAGQEAIIRENGKVELTPNKATITYLNPNDQVISHHDLIKNASYVHLMKQGNVSTSTNDKFQSAEIVEEIKDLKKVLINKNLSVNTTNYGGFDSYLKSHIR
jgi:hypothetical protein